MAIVVPFPESSHSDSPPPKNKCTHAIADRYRECVRKFGPGATVNMVENGTSSIRMQLFLNAPSVIDEGPARWQDTQPLSSRAQQWRHKDSHHSGAEGLVERALSTAVNTRQRNISFSSIPLRLLIISLFRGGHLLCRARGLDRRESKAHCLVKGSGSLLVHIPSFYAIYTICVLLTVTLISRPSREKCRFSRLVGGWWRSTRVRVFRLFINLNFDTIRSRDGYVCPDGSPRPCGIQDRLGRDSAARTQTHQNAAQVQRVHKGGKILGLNADMEAAPLLGFADAFVAAVDLEPVRAVVLADRWSCFRSF
jgi:hypothetical protein